MRLLVLLPLAFLIAGCADDLPTVTMYRSPTCGCCTAWADHMRAAGFEVETHDVPDVTPIKERYGVPAGGRSCHTALVGDYVIEGHVPASDVVRLLRQQPPNATGLAVPGMPVGSPGMEMPGRPADRYDVLVFSGDSVAVYARH